MVGRWYGLVIYISAAMSTKSSTSFLTLYMLQVDSSVRSLELEWQGKCDAAAVVEGAKVIFLVLLRCRGRLEPSNQSNSQPSHAVEV